MKPTERMSIKWSLIFILCLSIFLIKGSTYAEEGNYPMKVEIIEKNQARYDTPENTLAAIRSALKNEDLEWVYETLTEESGEEHKRLFEEAGIDPRKIFDLERHVKDTYIIDRIEYKDAVLLVIEDHHKDGTIAKYPTTFVREGGKWKQTNKFAGDEELHEYLDYTKPEEQIIISSKLRIRPTGWNLNWYNWIKKHIEEREWIKHFAERVSILCLIGNLKDNKGTLYSVKEISLETILLNDILPPQPWMFKREEKIALILKSKKDRYPKKIKGFKEWHHRKRFLKDYKGPIMLVKFNKFKAMETIPEMTTRKEYEVIVSGELKDGKPFKGTAKIEITEWKSKHRWKWKHPDWLNSERDIDNWWNKERDFGSWWEKIRKKHKPKTRGKRKSQ